MVTSDRTHTFHHAEGGICLILLVILLVFFGFCIGWVSTTIARYVYPPPKRWGSNLRQA